MHKRILVSLIIGVVAILACACGDKNEETTVVVAGSYSKTIAELFPDKEGFRWVYYGTADYGHEMILDKIYEANSQKVIKVKGEVTDHSSGETNLNYDLEVTYAIESDRVVQSKLSDAMMDSEYDHITLIMEPLAVGTTWREETVDSQGKKAVVNGEIIEIEENEEGTIYKVLYSEDKSDYSEVRKIQKGRGVVDFLKTLKYEDQSMEIAYHLYSLVAPDANPKENSSSTEVDKIKGVIFKFDELWIDFVNQGDTSLLDYVSPESPVESMINSYKRDDTKQKYLSIEVGEVKITGDTAEVKVYEKMQQNKGEDTQIFEYNWIYHLKKNGEQWYLYSYDEDKSL